MTWYKIAKDFTDRNLLNHKIDYLKEVKDNLGKMSDMIFQSGKITKQDSYGMIINKKMSSYPQIREILIEAESIALDNPWKFSVLCHKAMDSISKKIIKLEKERQEFGDTKTKKSRKGWVYD